MKIYPPTEFPVPEQVVFANIDAETGKLVSSQSKEVVRQAFIENSEPQSGSEEDPLKKDPFVPDETDFIREGFIPLMKSIEINKAWQNNLKGINVQIPLGSLTVICGLSGSGKSSLAFETLYAEGQRRYLQNLSNYLKQYIIQQSPPKVENISNLPPALALEQKNTVKSSRSTRGQPLRTG